MLKQVTTVIVNHNTAALLSICLSSLRDRYPTVPVLIIDNASLRSTRLRVKKLLTNYDRLTVVLNSANVGHGPAMHQAMKMLKSKYVFTLDTDCRVVAGGFLEKMLKVFEDELLTYAVGKLFLLNKLGLHTGVEGEPYIHPYAALFDRKKYLRLAPFNHHGAPAVLNMRDAVLKGYWLESFPIQRYVYHAWAGTRGKYGVPDWDGNASEALPEKAKSAEKMLRRL